MQSRRARAVDSLHLVPENFERHRHFLRHRQIGCARGHDRHRKFALYEGRVLDRQAARTFMKNRRWKFRLHGFELLPRIARREQNRFPFENDLRNARDLGWSFAGGRRSLPESRSDGADPDRRARNQDRQRMRRPACAQPSENTARLRATRLVSPPAPEGAGASEAWAIRKSRACGKNFASAIPADRSEG